jgi:hypothetical protein
MEGQSSALPSNGVVTDRSYSSSSLNHSLWILEGQSRHGERALAEINTHAVANRTSL